MKSKRLRRSGRGNSPVGERLEPRVLLAADLIAHWQAQDLVDSVDDGAVVGQWTDSVGGIAATATGEPMLSATALGGRAGLRFDPADGPDVLNVNSPENPAGGAENFSIAVVFATNSSNLEGEMGNWFRNTALVDSNSLGFSTDWGISINASGQVAAGIGGGFGKPPTNVYSDSAGLNDGQTHLAIFSRSGTQMSVRVDDLPAVSSDVSAAPLSRLDLSFGAHQRGEAAFEGFLAEVRIYDNALDDAETATLYADFLRRYDNQAPQAQDDDYTLEEDVSIAFIVRADAGVLTNDTDPESDALTAELVEGTQHGKLTLRQDGSFFYDPDEDFFGVDRFTYAAVDFRPSAPARVTLNVSPVYDGAIANDDFYKAIPGELLTIEAAQGVLSNDVNRDLADWSVQLDQDVDHGSLALRDDGSFRYDPQGFAGTATFTYLVNDGTQLSASTAVTIAVNTPPVAAGDAYALDEDTRFNVTAVDGVRNNDSDADGDVPLVEIVQEPMHGNLTLEGDGSFVYEPVLDYFGADSFTYRLNDGVDHSDDATVTLDVRAVNDNPVTADDTYFTLPASTLVVPAERGLLANDSDVDSPSLKAVLIEEPRNSVLQLADDGSFQLTPNVGFIGDDVFTYVADDSTGRSNVTEVRISISTRPLVINEFLATNSSVLETRTRESVDDAFAGDAQTPDWIEIKNLVSDPLDIGGMHLTDDADELTKWTFPAGTVVPPDGYLVVFASGNNILDPELDENGRLHTNFSINSGGDYLAVSSIEGSVIHEIGPTFPPQVADASYGFLDGVPHYFDPPTPGEPNTNGLIDIVADTSFSVDRGYFGEPFELLVTTPTPGATLIYTTDGNEPSLTEGTQVPAPAPDEAPVLSLTIDSTTTLRVAAFKDGYLPASIDTQTYFFLDDIVQQDSLWSTVTENPEWAAQLRDSFLALPTVSLVLEERISAARERATSVELIFPDGTEGFQINAGVEHYGGHSLGSPKKNMRLSFKSIYGDSKLQYDLFGGDATDEFNQLLLRTGSHDTWFWTHPDGGVGTYVRNRWAFDRQLEMGQLAPHGRYVQVFINGEYWGLHNAMERPNADFMASYLGGDASQYDALNAGTPIDGDNAAWRQLQREEVIDDYEQLQQYLDLDNYADYMLLQFYAANDWDWNHSQNWGGARKREEGAGYIFFSWDSDVMLRTNHDADVVNRGGPGDLWNRRGGVKQHDEFLMLMADRAHRYFFNNGMLTDERLRQDIDALANEIRLPMVAETARWGRRGFSGLRYTPDAWQRGVDWLKNVYAPENQTGRTAVVLGQLRRHGIYPSVDAPEYTVNGARQHGGDAASGDALAMVADGTVYYTLDGSDPRMPGGALNPKALIYDGSPILLDRSVVAKSRVFDADEWSALSEAEFLVDIVAADATNLRISEVNYHPADPTAEEHAAGHVNDDDFEFVELINLSDKTIDLSNVQLQRLQVAGSDQGVAFDFAESTVTRLAAGERLVVVEDLAAFRSRYGSEPPVAGQWSGGLNNLQEQLTLAVGETIIQQFTYRDSWYPATDGAGRSLEVVDVAQDLTAWSQAFGWRASGQLGGSPGSAGTQDDISGDSNRDGIFDSSDLILVFQAGEYEDDSPGNSTWEEGDWNGDGDFSTSDLVLAFQDGHYQVAAIAAFPLDSLGAALLHADRSHQRGHGRARRDALPGVEKAQPEELQLAARDLIFGTWTDDEDRMSDEQESDESLPPEFSL